MRFVFKTSYDQDIRLARDGVDVFWYLCLGVALVAAPWLLSDYWLDQMTFVLIYAIIGLGMMLITGFTGLFSLGHAAFLGVGAYTQAVMVNAGVPFVIALACAALLAACVGVVVGLPALRVKGIYLAMATLAFGFIVEEGITRWESVTGGNAGLALQKPSILGWSLDSTAQFYGLCLVVCVAATLAFLNLLRTPTGRAFVAIRDSEVSAQSMGINLAYYKTLSFALSAALAGIGGALYAHKIQFLSPDQFGIMQSIELLLLVVIGGLGSAHGAFFGALYVVSMPQLIAQLKDQLPPAMSNAAGLQSTIYGVILVAFILFEPLGVYGRWVKIRTYLELFPFYRQGMFKRQKSYQKSERLK